VCATVGAIALYVNFVFIAAGCFAALAFMLNDQGGRPLFLPRAQKEVNHGTLADYLLWHVLDAIPGLKVPGTIKWAAPRSDERPGAGAWDDEKREAPGIVETKGTSKGGRR